MMLRSFILTAALLWSADLAVGAPHTRVDLLLSHAQARPGDMITAGVRLRMDPGWHTYWENPGDSGGATTLDWKMPAGISAGRVEWPVPERVELAGLTTYAFQGEAILLVPLVVADNCPPGPVNLELKVGWLECAETCLPGETVVRGALVIGNTTEESHDSAILQGARARLPRNDAPSGLRAAWDGPAEGEERWLSIAWSGTTREAEFFPRSATAYEVGATNGFQAGPSGVLRLRKLVTRREGEWPTEVTGVLVVSRRPELIAYNLVLQTGTESPPGQPVSASAPALGWMLVLAFLGGLILNVMPCVLPVIALKVLSFVKQSQESAATVRRQGLIYGAGVLVSFAVLAGLVVLLQQAGRLANWGMQFQSAGFLLAMTVLVTLVALNLFGVFEVALRGSALGKAAGLASQGGAAGAFFNGVLATTLATPCTAPVLGTAVGFAFAQPPAIILLMFLVIGMGLAAPYVALSFLPGLARFLPRPGAWMERFKVAMGFPMLAAAVWLLSLLARHFGSGGVLWVGVFLVILACSAWVWGRFVQCGGAHRGLAGAIAVAMLVAGYLVVLEGQLRWRQPGDGPPSSDITVKPGGIRWRPWSPEAVEAARARGSAVLVDFTADWCFTCQANKRTSLEIPAVEERLRETDTVALLADYTLKNDAITQELLRHGRAGVPMVLVYPRDKGRPPALLPELLTPAIVLEALDRAVR